jgi:hypothetical protein
VRAFWDCRGRQHELLVAYRDTLRHRKIDLARFRRIFLVAVRPGEGLLTEPTADTRACRWERVKMSSRPEDSHLRALPDPYVNLSIHPTFAKFRRFRGQGSRF